MSNTLLLERFQILSGFAPVSLVTARTGTAFSMKNYRRALILFFKAVGTASDDPTLTILQGTDIAFATNKALNFADIWVKQDLTKLQDVAQWTRVTRTTPINTYTDDTSAEQQALWAVEFKAEDLDAKNGYDCIRASVSDVGTNAQLGSLLYLLGDPVYPSAPENMRGAVAD